MAADELAEAQVSPTWQAVFQHEAVESESAPQPPRPVPPDEPGEAAVSPAWNIGFRHTSREVVQYSAPFIPPVIITNDQPEEAVFSQTWRNTWQHHTDATYPAFDVTPPGNVISITDVAASADSLLASAITEFPADTELAGAVDGISVFKFPIPPEFPLMLAPGPAVFPGPATGPASAKLQPGTPAPALALPPASPAFIRSQMPRMHVENLITHRWLHRDVQGITSPLVTWMLNGADTFTCTLDPPRADLLDGNGEPLFNEWQSACYLEESGEIKFGGILTASTMQGPSWNQTWTGFAGYPNGIPYEGPAYSKINIEALDVVRYIWDWIQRQDGMHLGMILDNTQTGALIGTQTNPSNLNTTIQGQTKPGFQRVVVRSAQGLRVGMKVLVGGQVITANNPSATGGEPAVIASIGLGHPTSGTASIFFTQPLKNFHNDGAVLQQAPIPVPFTLDWWNSTDLGQEITSIQQDAVFDYREQHLWSDQEKRGVTHHLRFGVPRIGQRRLDLRFVEGENIIQPGQVSRDGSVFASQIVGMGAGQGATTIRSTVADTSTGRLRRVQVYQDQTVKHQARMSSKARRVLQSLLNIDTFSSIMIKNHSHAPFGSFMPGDDILVQLTSGWRQASIWHRILQMSQDPTTDLMTLTLARSDSFTYMAQSGQAGTL